MNPLRLLLLFVALLPTTALAVSALSPWTCGEARYCTQGTAQGDHVGGNYWAVDFGLPLGEPILAARAGTVTALKTDGVGGCCSSACNWRMNYVILDHGDGTTGLYYHLDTGSSSVSVGQWVPQGAQLARTGYTGFSCGNNSSYIGDGSWADASAAHLHFLVRDGSGASVPVDFEDLGRPVTWGLYTSGNCGGAPEPAGGCGGLGYAGECAGETVRWCQAGELRTKDCGSLGQVCRWQDDATGYNCVAPPADPCEGLTAAGICEGAVLRWCESGVPKVFDCAAAGMGCGWQDDNVGNNCLPAAPVDPCAELGYAGRCEGSTLQWCEGGVVKSYNCAWAGMACGWQGGSTGYNCVSGALSSPEVVPSAKRPPPSPKADGAGADLEPGFSAMSLSTGCAAAPAMPLALLLLGAVLPLLARRR
ncbi:MAG: M23 family metallopeptidase [Myxococcaceae bacterium]